MRSHILAIALAASLSPIAVAPALAETAQTDQVAHYSVDTTPAGTLIDDPAAAAILQKLIPTVWANDLFQSSGRGLTLRAIQQFEPNVLSDATLAQIQAELDKIPAKK